MDYDIVIVGGGMVGSSLAIALAGQGLDIALVDAWAPGDPGQPSYDDRAIALAYGSRRIFDGMGVWSSLGDDVEPIRRIHVSDRGNFGFTRLSAQSEGVPALGYVVTARQLGHHLRGQVAGHAEITVIAPAEVVDFHAGAHSASLSVNRDGESHILTTRLLVAADGGQSFIRERLQIPLQQWDYGQAAVIANITPARAHEGVAYERFTESGPVALLPMSEQRCALVWTVRDDDKDRVLALDDRAFLSAFQERFGYRLGRFVRVGRRSAHQLQLIRAKRSVSQRIAIIGNAAHTLHPIAGQGFNLGIRDVAALAELVSQAARDGADIGSEQLLAEYERWRIGEQRNVALATDGLARLFSNPLAAVKFGRNLGLLAMDLLPGSKHLLARAAMGMLGRLPRLSRGLRLD